MSGSTRVSGTGVGASGGGYGAAADGRGIGGASGGGDGAAADGRGIGGADASGSAEVSVGVDAILDGAPGVAPEELGGGAGVRATGRGRARLGALTTRDGLNVDGWRLRLGDLGPLAPRAALEADARLATDAHLEASAELAHATLPAGEGETDVVVRVRGGQPAATRARVRVHLVVDRSSSMHSAWPEVLAAAEALLEQLQPQDEIHIVAYGSDAIEVLPPVRVGSGQRAREALAGISIGGGTHLEAGLRVAYGAAARVRDDARPLVILVSDGVPNRGAFGVGELAPLAAEARAELGCPTTVIGLGDQFDARLLRGLSAAGRGGYHVAPDARAVGPMLRAEIRAHVRAAARDVRVNVALPDGVELAGELPVEAEAHAGGVRLALPELAAGEERRLTFRVRVRVQARVQPVAGVRVAWRGPAGARVAERALSVERGTRARLRSEAAALAVADAALGQALDLAADHVLNGRRERAVATLRAHVRVQARAPVGGTLRIRTQAVGRFAGALDALVDDASHGERRSLSLAMGALAARLGR
ncbi:MAG TPA: VWA domain-containing protein [Polyangiaceae bacterium LLY-WYZ-15_(1-7)]|nr:VWA domain-containing protein [Polyangiaceae bacterium LLY-WYZ-15_(1-7)]HJL21610.1 VWA domain-containing protein [Polyangiaceae bacterium LLY-WYZ-15_(1-7)]HJL30207.1 VWA domain-containing protein [Polyangiaceae bacterium LLY-WYZ-15_(1-7)]